MKNSLPKNPQNLRRVRKLHNRFALVAWTFSTSQFLLISRKREFFNNHRHYHQQSQCEIGGSIKGDVNKKTSPPAGSREVFCLDIQPTVCRCGSRSLERSSLVGSSVPWVSFSGGDNVRRFLKLGKRFDFGATMVLSEARGLSLFLVLRGGIAWAR